MTEPEGRPAVSLRGVTVRYGEATALEGVDLDVAPGERVAVAGPSGAGKSTLLSVLNGSVRPSAGRVEVLGRDVSSLRGDDLRRLRARIGTVYQQFHLVGPLRVVHNVNAGRLGGWGAARALWSLVSPDSARARAALARVGLAGKLLERTDRLSGGEQQRVALARALVQDPDLMLADEPVASLDPVRAAEVMELLGALAAERGTTLVVSLHDLALARAYCGRVVGLREGSVVFDVPAAEAEGPLVGALYAT